MAGFGGSRSRTATTARDVFERLRSRYFQVHPGLRFLAGLLVSALVVAVAVLLGWPVPTAAGAAVVALAAGHLVLLSPAGTAVVAVAAAWIAAAVPLAGLYPPGDGDARLLAVLAAPVAVVALRLGGYAPWRTAALALCAAAPVAAVTAVVAPAAHVAPAWMGAAAVLLYRWSRSRSAVIAEAYETGWAQEQAADPGGGGPCAVPEPQTSGTTGETGGGTAGVPAAVQAAYEERVAEKGRTMDASEPDGPADGDDARPDISVTEALAELDAMVGLEPVKRQVRSLAASIEAAHLRAAAGVPTEKPMRHFVFVGPPGTGKTTVARVLARIFHAFGLLPRADVVEVGRSDLVGEHLGATALKTNRVIDSALGGVLFVDEAYSLVNAADGQPDRFGNEAVQTLLKRAEDDRANLVIILAGYETQMAELLDSNPGLASRFGTRVHFPGYRSAELLAIAEGHVASRGDRLDGAARDRLAERFEEVRRRGIADELGNGRFVRSLAEAAARARDLRVVGGAQEAGPPSADALVTLRVEDVDAAFAEATERYRDFAETPTLSEALGELDRLIGLEPVKRQVREITAQLQVARLRRDQGLPNRPPMRHFVFTGPPGTGKTTVARTLGAVFAALGLLSRPAVVETQRADLVGDHLGATALKTNRVIDSALGGVLFVDEAYSLVNPGYAGGDAFGAEAVQTLLKRAEDDRDRLVVVLAGYEEDMRRFLTTNPGLASRFDSRVEFPSYGPDELLRIAQLIAEQSGDVWEDGALDDLALVFQRVVGQGRVDELGNGRFARSLYEKASACRALRAAELGAAATPEDLTVLRTSDVREAVAELTRRTISS